MLTNFNTLAKSAWFAVFFLTALAATAQKGVLKGIVVDGGSGETLIGATVAIMAGSEIKTGTVTDFDGTYTLDVEPGTYVVEVSYVSFTKQTITDVVIEDGKVNNLDVSLASEAVQLEAATVTATAVKNTEVALLALQRKAFSIQDGLSSQQISRTGSSNAADAMRQMTGAVVEGGRFIVMRGLGDRYSISQLNGITMPSTDPYRNSSSLDLIPSQMIENIITVKTFTPDLPGNFTGGLVNIATKTFPDKFNFNFSIGTEYNTQASLIDNFNAHPTTGKSDWLGLDDGSRDQPALLLDPANRNLLSQSTYLTARQPGNDKVREVFHESARQLSNEFIPVMASAPLNRSLSLSLGNRHKVFGRDLGYTLAVNYSGTYTHYNDGDVNTWINNSSPNLFDYQALKEDKSTFNPSLNGLFNIAYKLSENHALTANVIFNNDAEFVGRSQNGRFLGQVSNSLAEFNTNALEFTHRQLTTYQLGGRHVFPGLKNVELDWMGAFSSSFQNEPDLRYFAYTSVTEGEETQFDINNAEYAFPYHFFRSLNDEQRQAKVDITIPFLTNRVSGSGNRIKVGGYYSQQTRDFEEYRYQLNNTGVSPDRSFSAFAGDFDAFWNYDNFGIVDTLYRADGSINRYVTGYHYINQINNRNFYTGEQTIAAAYAMAVYNLTAKLKVIGGLRLETTNMQVESRDTLAGKGNIDQTDLLYSLNLIYNLSEKANIRGAASRTLARPNLRELAPFEQFDTKNGFFNVGNPNLQRTLIQNYDLRFEVYPKTGELLALSVFYKQFTDPIIRAFNPRATIPELSFVNVSEAQVYGVELEFRKNLGGLGKAFDHFYFSGNAAFIQSSYPIPADELANHQVIDPTYDQTERPFQSQAPFIVNAILTYLNPDKGWESSMSFNVLGRKLYNIALFGTPDVYEEPFPLLNFKLSKRFANNYQASFTARNLLNPINKKTQIFRDQEYIAESFRLGTSLGITLSYFIR